MTTLGPGCSALAGVWCDIYDEHWQLPLKDPDFSCLKLCQILTIQTEIYPRTARACLQLMQSDIMSNGVKMSLWGKLLISECIVTEGNGGGGNTLLTFITQTPGFFSW